MTTLCGSGTKSDPYLVESIEHFRHIFNSDLCRQKLYFRQTKNLDVSTTGFMYITFKGVYDGDRYALIGTDRDQSIFNSIEGGKFQNIEFANCTVTRDLKETSFNNIAVYNGKLVDGRAESMGLEGAYVRGNPEGSKLIEYTEGGSYWHVTLKDKCLLAQNMKNTGLNGVKSDNHQIASGFDCNQSTSVSNIYIDAYGYPESVFGSVSGSAEFEFIFVDSHPYEDEGYPGLLRSTTSAVSLKNAFVVAAFANSSGSYVVGWNGARCRNVYYGEYRSSNSYSFETQGASKKGFPLSESFFRNTLDFGAIWEWDYSKNQPYLPDFGMKSRLLP